MKRRHRTTEVCAFRAGKLTPGGPLPDEIVVVPWGRTDTRDRGPVICDERTAAVFEANQKAARRDAVPGDFEHGTLRGKEPLRVACYGVPQVIPGRGIVVRVNHWTPDGKEHVSGGHYPDISPAVIRRPDGVVTGLHSFAFCRHGELAHPDLELFSIDEDNNTNQPMNYLKMLNALLAAAGVAELAEDATEEQAAAAVAAAMKGLKGESPDAMSAALKPLNDQITALTAQVRAMQAGEAERRVDGLIAEATAKGKKIGLKRETLVAMGAAATAEYLGTLDEGVVPLQANNGGAGTKQAEEPEAFSAEQLEVMKRCGIDPADVKKTAAEMHGLKL